ncbi:esterase/lipase family protein [Planctomycetaceae bacterium SH139]
MHRKSLLIVHGFGVASCIFRPFMRRIERGGLAVQLFRYPSVGLELRDIVDRLSASLRESPPDAIIAHSLGCVATWLAVHDNTWRGPIVFLAPPLKRLPLTRLIPPFLRWPFAPLLDHRALMAAPNFRLPELSGCTIRTVAGRCDLLVPLSCTYHDDITDPYVTMDTHNSMLFSPRIARQCCAWLTN